MKTRINNVNVVYYINLQTIRSGPLDCSEPRIIISHIPISWIPIIQADYQQSDPY